MEPGVDAATKHDAAAVIALYREGKELKLTTHRIWKPTKNEPIDLEATIGTFVRQLNRVAGFVLPPLAPIYKGGSS